MIRVLFIDDEPRVLDGIRRSLPARRRLWHAVYAESGAAGCKALESEEFDVIITDLAMPGIDGYEVLERARKIQPDAMRIVFSGQTDPEATMRAVHLAHQFLSKPCEGDEIQRVIERAAMLRHLFTNQVLRQTVSSVGTLPSCPEVYLELTRVLQDPESSAQDAADVLERDIAMCSKILQIVNSAFFGLPRSMTSVRDAVAFLGLRMVRAVAFSEAAFRPFEGRGIFTNADLAREQQRGFDAGALARSLCPDKELEDQAYLAGMLHDIGWVILGCMLPEAYKDLVDGSEGGVISVALEREVLGTTHAEIGAFLLGTWGLPLPVVEAVAYHHRPGAVAHGGFEVLTAVHAASGLLAEINQSSPERPSRLDKRYLGEIGFLGELPRWRELRDDGVSTEEEEAA